MPSIRTNVEIQRIAEVRLGVNLRIKQVNTTIQDKIELLEEVQQAEIQFENGQGLCNADARAQVLAQLNK